MVAANTGNTKINGLVIVLAGVILIPGLQLITINIIGNFSAFP